MPLLPGGLRGGGTEEEVATAVRAPTTTPHYTAAWSSILKHIPLHSFTFSLIAVQWQRTAIGKLGPPCKGGGAAMLSPVRCLFFLSRKSVHSGWTIYPGSINTWEGFKVNHTLEKSGLKSNLTSQVLIHLFSYACSSTLHSLKSLGGSEF